MSSAKTVDLLIIGGGPAGLSTASTFARLGRPCLLYDSHAYRNANSTSAHTIPGFEGANPADYRAKFREQLVRDYAWLEFRDDKIVDLSKTANGVFKAKDAGGNEIQARKVVLATGLKDTLPPVPGLQEIWGTRAVHCVFCHGTETRHSPIAILLNAVNPQFNPMLVESFLKLWGSLGHPKVYILTNGIEVDSDEGKAKAGVAKYMDIIAQKRYKIITSPLTSVDPSKSDTLTVNFDSHPSISLGYINLLPQAMSPNADALPFLPKSLLDADLTPMGTVPIIKPDALGEGDMKLPPGFGDDPRTPVKGLLWAGNSGNMMGNINLSVIQGQTAGFLAGEELGSEDLKELQKKTMA